jgi:peptidoglycan/LPS O-acetylase OafA/YrhL
VPGLAGVVIFTIFVIGPINTSLSLQEYYFNIHTWIYSGVILIFSPYQTLPGVFMSNPYPTAVNASLWTIPIEFGLYILLCIMGVIGMLKDRRVLLSVVVLSCAIYINGIWTCVWPVLSDALRHIGTPDALGHMGISKYLLYLRNAVIPANSHIYNLLFFIGSLFFIYKDQIKFSNRLALGAFIGLLILIDSATSYQDIAVLICLPYLVLYIGQLPIRQLYNIGDKYGDYSYGLYIYAFPVQQTIAHFIPKISPIQMFALSLPSTFIFAYISWWLIEKKALSLKKMDPKKIFLDKFRYVTTLL